MKEQEGKDKYDFDVYGIEDRFAGIERRIHEGIATEREHNSFIIPIRELMITENQEAAIKFNVRCYASGLMGKKRLLKYEVWFRNYDRILGKPFADATREDLERVLFKVKDSSWSDATKADFHILLKRYYKITEGEPKGPDYPERVKWIATPRVEPPNLNFDDCPSWDDVQKMSDHCSNLRDKALILSTWEGGLRILEALTLRVGSVQQAEHGLYLSIEQSKTTRREVFILLSAPIITQWLNVHPLRNDPKAPLFCRIDNPDNYTMAMGYRYARKLNDKLKKKAGINKAVNPHMLRHGSASYFCDHLTDSDMEAKYGWRKGSPHKARYQHKHNRAVETKILGLAGIYADTGVKNIYKEAAGDEKECYKCHEKSPANFSSCYKCGTLLTINLHVAFKAQKLKEKLDDMSAAFLEKNPGVLKSFVDHLSSEAEKKIGASGEAEKKAGGPKNG